MHDLWVSVLAPATALLAVVFVDADLVVRADLILDHALASSLFDDQWPIAVVVVVHHPQVRCQR